MEHPPGRQYRFLSFFILAAGLVLPALCALTHAAVYLSAMYAGASSAAADYNFLMETLSLAGSVSLAAGTAALILAAIRYSFRRCLRLILFIAGGNLLYFAYILAVSVIGAIQYKAVIPAYYLFVYGYDFIAIAAGPLLLYLIAVLMRRLPVSEIAALAAAAVAYRVLSAVGNVASVYAFVGWQYAGVGRTLLSAVRSSGLDLLYMAAALAAILLIFRHTRLRSDMQTPAE